MRLKEAQALVKYDDDIKNHRWDSKPQIRKYDKVYNGKLRIVFGERSYIRDNDSEKLENRQRRAGIGKNEWRQFDG